MARRDAASVRLLIRNGYNWSARFPAILEAVSALQAHSCLIEGEAVAPLKKSRRLGSAAGLSADRRGGRGRSTE